MYKEIAKSKNKTYPFVIGAVILYLFVLFIIKDAPYKGIIQLAALFICALAIYLCLRYNIREYEYHITEDELLFLSRLGGAERIILAVPLKKVLYIAPDEKGKAKYRYNAKKSFGKKDSFALWFYDEKENLSKISFNPTEEYLKKAEESGIELKRR